MLYPTELRGRFSRDKKVSSAFFPFYPRQWRAGALERREEFSSSQPFYFLGLDSAQYVFPGVYKSLVGVEEGSGGEKKERTEEKELSVQRGKKVQEEGHLITTFRVLEDRSLSSLPSLFTFHSFSFKPQKANDELQLTAEGREMRFKKAETLFVEGGDDGDARCAAAARRRRPSSASTTTTGLSSPSPSSPGSAPKLDASNPGYSMLRSMGWSEASPGLGKAGQGRREPVRAAPRRAREGLGAAGAKARGCAGAEGGVWSRAGEAGAAAAAAAAAERRLPPAPAPPPVDPAAAAARQRGAALVAELLSRDFDDFGHGGSVDASQRALNPLLDSEGSPARRHRRRNPLLLDPEGEEQKKDNV